ncbi:hypothetical protein EKG37_07775 [Robertmurraya yapensis]|uniref:Yip1 domain-containing protein n=1 Tax=Bacillus yapensis TaxID=2492960 RepID=A0A431WBT8_9BACI|nr:hypothetical protein [Bacillus yapensis]RTR32952.1 hypothetical protein EKG37_07775 [Bacillus yapensis]TKS96775.1 hypothetical protein FAR12_07775 [Bacillus yapensis]
MFFQIRLWKGLTTPYVTAHQLRKAESYNGIWKRTTILLVIALILSSISAYFGIGNEQMSKLIYQSSTSEFESLKGLFALGQVLQYVLVTAILIFLPALIFWIFTDVEYRKLVVIQLYVVTIFLFEKIIAIPMQLFLGLDYASSPFSLGVIGQHLSEHELIQNLFGEISLFSILAILIQFTYLKVVTEKSKRILLLLILSINLLIWIFTALFSFIKFEVLF